MKERAERAEKNVAFPSALRSLPRDLYIHIYIYLYMSICICIHMYMFFFYMTYYICTCIQIVHFYMYYGRLAYAFLVLAGLMPGGGAVVPFLG